MEAQEFNRLIANGFERTWEATGQLPDPKIEVNLDSEFARLTSRIAADGQAENGRVVQLGSRRNWLRYAAAAAVLGLVSFGVWQFLPAKNTELALGNPDSKTEALLADGSHVFVNRGSKLTCPEKFTGEKRLVKLSGEAYFDIAKDAAKPFIIETEVAKIQVVGTRFNVKSAPDRCEIFVEEGHVIVENNGQTGHLTAGQGTIVYKNGAKFQPATRPNAAAWAHDQLRFDNARLQDVLADLSDFYKVTITTDDAGLQNSLFTWSKPVSGKLADVLEIVASTFDARVVQISEKEFKLVKN